MDAFHCVVLVALSQAPLPAEDGLPILPATPREVPPRAGRVLAGPSFRLPLQLPKPVVSLSFSDDGGRLLANCARSARLFDTRTGRLSAVYRGAGPSSGAEGIVAVPEDDSPDVTLWEASSSRKRAVLRGHGDPVTCLAISLDAMTLASGDGKDTVRLWDVPRGRAVAELRDNPFDVRSLRFSPDGDRAVLDAVTGGDAARLYERLGWVRAGDVPGYALYPDGRPCGTTFYNRNLGA